jgi:glucosylceramidase
MLLLVAVLGPSPAVGRGALARTARSGSVLVTQTTPDLSRHLTRLPAVRFSPSTSSRVPVIEVDDQTRDQFISGIGAAMTDSSAWLIHNELGGRARAVLLTQLFGRSGARLSFLRVPMGASDFSASRRAYTYDDRPRGQSDPRLLHFSIGHDLAYTVPVLQQARRINPRLELLANPWTPPAWMKANHSLNNVGAAGSLLRSAYAPLASYFVKFLRAYAGHALSIQAITPQNEPSYRHRGSTYPGMTLVPSQEAKFLTQYLFPALRAAKSRVKVYANDLSWISRDFATPLLRAVSDRRLTGVSWHCYAGAPMVMTQTHETKPTLDQIADECSPEIANFGTAEYVISSLRNWASAVSVWNIALDPGGGPKVPLSGCPGCQGVATIDERTRSVSLGLEYYQLGQVSRFLQPGARRIDSTHLVHYKQVGRKFVITGGIDDIAYLNSDGTRVLAVYNNSGRPAHFAVTWHKRAFTATLGAGAMSTFVWSSRA